MTWGKVVRRARAHTGEFYCTENGKICEAVETYSWGGVELLYSNGQTATHAIGDIVPVATPDNEARFLQFEFDEQGKPIILEV